MGWCSGTEIFDRMAEYLVSTSYHEEMWYDVLLVLAEELEDNDWDCQQDSDYWDHPIVQRVMKHLHPDWDWEERG